jgi:hypothetical protein
MIPAADEEYVETNEQGTGFELSESGERLVKFVFASGLHGVDLVRDHPGGFLHILPL